MSKKKIGIIAIIGALLASLLIWFIVSTVTGGQADKVSEQELTTFINSQMDALAEKKTEVVRYIAEENEIVINKVTYGDEKDILLDCTVSTLDVHGAVLPYYNDFMSVDSRKPNGMQKTRDVMKAEFEKDALALVKKAKPTSVDTQITLYQTEHNGLVVYTTDEVVNDVYGGVTDIMQEVEGLTTFTDSEGETKKIASTNVNRGFALCFEVDYATDKPDTSTYWGRKWNAFMDDFNRNFIEYDRWKTMITGLGMTLALTFLSLVVGIVLGFLVAFARCTFLKSRKPNFLLRIINGICQVYLTVIRGTPVVVQVMIIYFVIFMPIGINKFLAAVVCFGLNSGAYVAEIVRGGIMSVDEGQTEAGRSLGFGYMQTMWYIVFPQAFKAVLPALANEFIVLLKETSVAFCIGLGDLMYAGNAIRAATYTAFLPLVTVAIIYLIMVIGFSKLVSLLERRLRKDER